MKTQKQQVMEYLEQYGSMTPAEAWNKYGISKLATIVSELIHKDGVKIEKVWDSGKNRSGVKSHFRKYIYKSEK